MKKRIQGLTFLRLELHHPIKPQTLAPLLIDGMDIMLRKYGLCTSSIAPGTEHQSWEKCDLTKHISRQNKENIENFIQHS